MTPGGATEPGIDAAAMTGTIRAISVSAHRGMAKTNVARAEVQCDHGIVGDAHAGPWHRQISLLAAESIARMAAQGARVGPGDFAENITTEGLDLSRLRVGDRLRLGATVELEITQSGKQCHRRCAVFQQIGDCAMPREGLFAKVIQPGWIAVGDKIVARRAALVACEHRATGDERREDIGFEEAEARLLQTVAPLAPVDAPIGDAGGLVVARDCVARMDCPSASVSLKDGYAVISTDLTDASAMRPVKLKVIGTAVAGGEAGAAVRSGTAVKITSGARVPPGADAVLACEFTSQQGPWVLCHRDLGAGRDILVRGRDVAQGEQIAARGDVLTPARTGLLAAGGIATVPVHPQPRIGILAVGDEIVTPGEPLKHGQLYASNVVVLRSWLRHFGMDAQSAVVGDDREHLAQQAARMLERVDVLITSGGAWKSDRDLTVDVLKALGADLVFHRVRMRPGKAVALLLKEGKVLFCLPGGPPSNEIAFLQLTLPGLLRLSGRPPVPFETTRAVLTEPVTGDKNGTQFIYIALERVGANHDSPVSWLARPVKARSRLRLQAEARALFRLPEGIEKVEPGTWIDVQVLHARAG